MNIKLHRVPGIPAFHALVEQIIVLCLGMADMGDHGKFHRFFI